MAISESSVRIQGGRRKLTLYGSFRVAVLVSKHLTQGISNRETFQGIQLQFHPGLMIGGPAGKRRARRYSEKFTRFREPKFANPVLADWANAFHRPPSESQIIVHA